MIRRTKEVEVFRNRYGALYNDDVVNAHEQPGKYLRWTWAHDGVVVVPVYQDTVLLRQMFRYSTGKSSIEFPRGGSTAGEALVNVAARELKEELGVDAESIQMIGQIYGDSGLIQNPNHVALAHITKLSDITEANPEMMESIYGGLIRCTPPEFLSRVARMEITCAITIAAWACFIGYHKNISHERTDNI